MQSYISDSMVSAAWMSGGGVDGGSAGPWSLPEIQASCAQRTACSREIA